MRGVRLAKLSLSPALIERPGLQFVRNQHGDQADHAAANCTLIVKRLGQSFHGLKGREERTVAMRNSKDKTTSAD